MPAATTYVYLVVEQGTAFGAGLVKIGTAKNPNARRRELQVGNGRPLAIAYVIEGGQALERELHEWFATYRTQGEWFDDRENKIRAYFTKNGKRPKPPTPGRPWAEPSRHAFVQDIPKEKLRLIQSEYGDFDRMPVSPATIERKFRLSRSQVETIYREELWREPKVNDGGYGIGHLHIPVTQMTAKERIAKLTNKDDERIALRGNIVATAAAKKAVSTRGQTL